MSARRRTTGATTKAGAGAKPAPTSRRPTRSERRALVQAYSDEHGLYLHEPGGVGGFRVKTLRGLVSAGWLEAPGSGPEGDEDWDDARLTPAGREALGVPPRPPRGFRAALEQAIEALFRVRLPTGAIGSGATLPTLILDDDTGFTLDTGTVRAALEVEPLGLDPDTPDQDEAERLETTWGAVAARMREAGHPVELELLRGYLIVYDLEE